MEKWELFLSFGAIQVLLVKDFMSSVRKTIPHGAGHDKMNLTLEQADYSLAHPCVPSRAIDD
jgi:hypothetical protein